VLTEINDAKIRLRDTFRKVFPPTEREKSINDGYIPMNREEENPSSVQGEGQTFRGVLYLYRLRDIDSL